MTPLASTAVTLAKNLPSDSAVDRAVGHGAPPAAFAGLLDAQQQRFSTQGGSSTAYNGSAFDVAPAQRPPARPAIAAAPPPMPPVPPKMPAREAQAAPKPTAERASQRSTPTPTAAQNNAPAKPAQADKQVEAERDDGAARSADAAAPDSTAADAAAPARVAGPGEPADAEPIEVKQPDAQSMLDWMARFAAPASAAAPVAAAALAAPIARGLTGATGDAPGAAGSAVAGASLTGGDAAGSASVRTDAAELAAALPAVGDAAHALTAESAVAPKTAESPIAALHGLAAPAAAQPPVGATATLAVTVPTPVDSPDFSQALASQLTTFARDGVHEAQLQLNPADMGPISVQITLDGSQAQIDFAAQHARTRDALEAAWPALAASLHSAGMTLGGGGVFEQRPGPRDGEAGAGAGRGAPSGAQDADDATGNTARTVRIDTQRGLLDLYA